MTLRTLWAAALLALPLAAMAEDTASWANWTSSTQGTLVQNGDVIDVTYSGSAFSMSKSGFYYDVPSSFTSATITNTPGTNGTFLISGGNATVHTFSFSQAVINPVIAVFSVGQLGVPVRFVFETDQFSVTSATANGHWGGGTLTQSANVITGREGNGLLEFQGTYTSISFTTPDYEYYYGAAIGAPLAAVPEPATLALAMGGVLVVAWRRQRTA